MLGQRRRRWPSIKATVVERIIESDRNALGPMSYSTAMYYSWGSHGDCDIVLVNQSVLSEELDIVSPRDYRIM